MSYYISFTLSTDKKLIIVDRDETGHLEYYDLFYGMHGCVLGWDRSTFDANVKSDSDIPDISDTDLCKLFNSYERFCDVAVEKLEEEALNLTKKIEAARRFDFKAAEKRIERINQTIKNINNLTNKTI